MFLATYNAAEGDQKYNAAADYSEDQVINPVDRTIFLANYNKGKIIEE